MEGTGDNLIARAVAGDREALIVLLESHTPRLRQRIAHRIPRRWRAMLAVEDVLQETYKSAYLNIHGFRSREDRVFAAWLFAIATRWIINAVRALEKKPDHPPDRPLGPVDRDASGQVLYDHLMANGSTPSRKLRRNEAICALRQALRRLPEHYQYVVEMFDLAQRPMKEVAKVLKCTLGAAHMIRYRALERLASTLGNASDFLSSE